MIQAGFFETDITPSIGMPNSCGEIFPSAKDISTPLSITAGVWKTDAAKVAVVGADVIIMQAPLLQRALAILKQRIGLDHLVFGASHTHEGGSTVDFYTPPADVDELTELEPEVREEIKKSMGNSVPEYMALIERRLVDAVVCADTRVEEVRLIMGKNLVEGVAYNRRYRMKNGFSVTHSGVGNPDAVDYAGPVDKEVVTLAAVNRRDKVTGMIVNFACHAQVAGGKVGYSADYPFYMREMLKKNINPRMVPVFLNGCCGDVTWIDNLSPEPFRQDVKWANTLGQRVGFGALDVVNRVEPMAFDVIKYASEDLPLKYREITAERYARDLAAVREQYQPGFKGRRGFLSGRDTILMRLKMRKQPNPIGNISGVQIGNLLLVSNANECFARIGLNIKAASSFEHTMVSELTNGYMGYLPTADVFGPHGGGYEGRLSGASFLEKDAWQKIQDAGIAMARRFAPEKVIAKPKVTNGQPWVAFRPEEL